MEYLDQPFDVNTGSSRRPTPLFYEHLRKWVAADEKFIQLHSQADITNVNKQFDDTANYYVSNVIQRVIAQLIGKYANGFITIEGTADGELKVYLDQRVIDAIEELKTLITLAEGSNLIGKVQIAGSSQTPLKEDITITAGGTHDIILATPDKCHNITTIVFTVGGEVNIQLRDESGTFGGLMDFGGTNEPRGMVTNHVLLPLKCTIGEKFQIYTVGDVLVSGYVIYFDE